MDWSDDIDPKTIPDRVILSERAKRNAARIIKRSGGGPWKKHNPNTTRCKCGDCTASRLAARDNSGRKPIPEPEQDGVRETVYEPGIWD